MQQQELASLLQHENFSIDAMGRAVFVSPYLNEAANRLRTQVGHPSVANGACYNPGCK